MADNNKNESLMNVEDMEKFNACMKTLEEELMKNQRIDPNLYLEYDVKRGLRDSAGKGVLTGLTEISDVCAFDLVEGRKIPAEGSLYYQGINVNDLVKGLNTAFNLGINTENINECFLRCENPIVLLKGNKTLREFNLRNGTLINID